MRRSLPQTHHDAGCLVHSNLLGLDGDHAGIPLEGNRQADAVPASDMPTSDIQVPMRVETEQLHQSSNGNGDET